MTAVVDTRAQAQAHNRRKRREHQAPVFARPPCAKARNDWDSDGLQSLFSAKRVEGRISQPGRMLRRQARDFSARESCKKTDAISYGQDGVRRRPDTGTPAGRKSPVRKTQAVESFGFSGVKKIREKRGGDSAANYAWPASPMTWRAPE